MNKNKLNAVYNFVNRLEIDEVLKVKIYLALLNQPNATLQQILNIINNSLTVCALITQTKKN